MKYRFLLILTLFICAPAGWAQSSIYKTEGTCGTDTKWTFDGFTLTIVNASKEGQYVNIADYDMKHQIAPWTKKKLDVKKIQIGAGITRIGSCAFAGLENLQESLRDMAEIRLQYPDATLLELGKYLDPPVGKSGVNHRLRKLSDLADKLRG